MRRPLWLSPAADVRLSMSKGCPCRQAHPTNTPTQTAEQLTQRLSLQTTQSFLSLSCQKAPASHKVDHPRSPLSWKKSLRSLPWEAVPARGPIIRPSYASITQKRAWFTRRRLASSSTYSIRLTLMATQHQHTKVNLKTRCWCSHVPKTVATRTCRLISRTISGLGPTGGAQGK